MGDFAQNGSVATLHNFGTKTLKQMEDDLSLFAGYRPMELILPSLYSELEGPALKEIVKNISQVRYLNNGVSKEEIRAIIHCVGIYGGVPLSLECFRAAKRVFVKQKIE